MVGCGPKASPDQAWVGGYPVSERVDCREASCDRFIDFATASLGAPPPAVRSVAVFYPDFRGPNGERILTARSGGNNYVVVFTLADGNIKAVYVGCGVGIDPERCFLPEPPTDV
jgi:hypothetical protein